MSRSLSKREATERYSTQVGSILTHNDKSSVTWFVFISEAAEKYARVFALGKTTQPDIEFSERSRSLS
jgi:hypothetical protein